MEEGAFWALSSSTNVFSLAKWPVHSSDNSQAVLVATHTGASLHWLTQSQRGDVLQMSAELLLPSLNTFTKAEVIGVACVPSPRPDEVLVAVTLHKTSPGTHQSAVLLMACPSLTINWPEIRIQNLLELDFFPWAVSPVENSSSCGFTLCGSDCRVHGFALAEDAEAFEGVHVGTVVPQLLGWSARGEVFCVDMITTGTVVYTALGQRDGTVALILERKDADGDITVRGPTHECHEELLPGPATTVHLYSLNDSSRWLTESAREVLGKSFPGCMVEAGVPEQVNLVVTSAQGFAVVFRNVLAHGLSDRIDLPFTAACYGGALSVTTACISGSGPQVLVGTHSGKLVVYAISQDGASVQQTFQLPSSIHCLDSVDMLGDGIANIVAVTREGIHTIIPTHLLNHLESDQAKSHR